MRAPASKLPRSGLSPIADLRVGSGSDAGFGDRKAEPRLPPARIGAGVCDVAIECDRVTRAESPRLLGDLKRDRALLHLQQLLRARSVRLAGMLFARLQRPIP